MYWDSNYAELCGFFEERKRKAKKEHKCSECKEVIPVGTEYLYIVGVWKDEGDYGRRYFGAEKMCLNCDADWKKVLAIFHDNGEDDACIIYGLLSEAVFDLFDLGFITTDDPLIKKWIPSAYAVVADPETEDEEPETASWQDIHEYAVKTGLQPFLPGL